MDFLPFTRPSIDEDTIAGVVEVLRSGWITSGPKVQAFEAALSEICGGRTVRAFNSGTATLEVALRLAGVGPGDEVVTTPLTWVATANVILEVGATPVLTDIDPITRNIDLDRLEAALTPRTRAVIPVDLAGLPVDRDRLYAIARTHRLRVVEDAAQSFGAAWNGQAIGSTGDFVSFSFHANKNLTTIEGGALVLPADVDVALCERLRLQGVRRFPDGGMDVDVLGGKFNLTDVAAAVGLGQLKHLDAFTARRRQLARRYFERLAEPDCAALGLELPPADFANSNWHMFQPLLPKGTDRGAFIAAMKAQGIGVGVHYPALHLFSLYRNLGFKPGQFPHAEDVGARTVTLPLFPAMSDGDVDRVVVALGKSLAELP
ncbi:aminotransferase DegT [Denitratisoma sp. DHT3]|uniref:DegT/DnrJ/EryC1/StrS family aminotransferase n=1 Tax=Denitratisoma sp. DHT3 TaxID=1981880 RepID=UPI001198900C|nr:DegT/DnrJ/EryC1/StrS aminotransferase family protein [Denitratisoma sp. DHT3]QDX80159.1 aminotransferase DegT [Denitratisoma sp. DHT3]